MAGSINKAILIGHLGRDPEIRALTSGGKVATFSMATSETWRDKATGERKERTQWHNIVVFNEGLVDVVEKYLRKGSKVYVEGQNETRKWTDKQGVDHYTTEIVLRQYRGEIALLDRAERAPGPDESAYGSTRDKGPDVPGRLGARTAQADAGLNDEIPF